jgi:AT-rich interactive domain-containing protein 1
MYGSNQNAKHLQQNLQASPQPTTPHKDQQYPPGYKRPHDPSKGEPGSTINYHPHPSHQYPAGYPPGYRPQPGQLPYPAQEAPSPIANGQAGSWPPHPSQAAQGQPSKPEQYHPYMNNYQKMGGFQRIPPGSSPAAPVQHAHVAPAAQFPPGQFPAAGHPQTHSQAHPQVHPGHNASGHLMGHPSSMHPSQPGQKPPQYLLNLLANNNGQPSIPPQPPMHHPAHHGHQPTTVVPGAPVYASHPNQLPPGHAPYASIPPSAVAPIKREMVFPPGSIESVQPNLTKRKRLTSRDLHQIEAWRLMMALKSGLLAESTWALDVLSILVHDDNTYLYFGLQHLPGLLEILLEYYKRHLSEMFDKLFDDISFEKCTLSGEKQKQLDEPPLFDQTFIENVTRKAIQRAKKAQAFLDERSSKKRLDNGLTNGDHKMNGKHYDDDNDELSGEESDDTAEEPVNVLNLPQNYTLRTRTGKQVKMQPDESLFITDFEKSWDPFRNGFTANRKDHWANGYGNITGYIQTHFEVKSSSLKFARILDERQNRQQNGASIKPASEDTHSNDKEKCVIINGSTNIDDIDCISDREEESRDEAEPEELCYPRFREPCVKRKFLEDCENEAYARDSPPLCTTNDYNDSIARRAVCLSTLIRNLSFVPGNETELSKHTGLLLILGRLILLHHRHPQKKQKPKRTSLKQLEESLAKEASDSDLFNNGTIELEKAKQDTLNECQADSDEWWWDALHFIRENTFVTLANISGQLDLSIFAESINFPIFDGLLHWSVCPASVAFDNLPSTSLACLSPKRLALECLAKLSIREGNVDLILSTPPWSRMIKLFERLAELLSRNEEQTLREFALVAMHNLAISDVSIARFVAISSEAIAQLISFVELAEQSAMHVANTQGLHALKENPELMGTTADMVKRAASLLTCLARVPENRPLFFNYQQRLIQLVMSHVLDPAVVNLIADVMYECSLSERQMMLENGLIESSATNSNENVKVESSFGVSKESFHDLSSLHTKDSQTSGATLSSPVISNGPTEIAAK